MPDKYQEFIDQKRIIIYDEGTALDTLKYFGISIKRIEIENAEFVSFTKVARFANEYASESLTHLKMDFMWKETFITFTKPFKQIESFDFFFIQKIENNRTFSEVFPKVQRLSLLFLYDIDYSYINCTLPHLQHLNFYICPNTWKNVYRIEEFLSANQQIRSVDTDQVKMISKFLPNITNLSIYDFLIRNEKLRFNYVKHLKVEMKCLKPLRQVSFPRIETLKMEFIPAQLTTHVYLFKQYRKLKKLDFEAYAVSNTTEIEKLVTVLAELIEFKLSTNADINASFVNITIQTHRNLRRIELKALDIDVPEIRQHFQNEWHIEEFINFNVFYIDVQK